MTREELISALQKAFPSEIDGAKRPAALTTNNEFFTDGVPPIIANDPVIFNTMNLLFSIFLSNDKNLQNKLDSMNNFVGALADNLPVTTQSDGHFVCPSLGVSGLIAQNGYLSLGKLFGSLILQWGSFKDDASTTITFTYPIKVVNILAILTTDITITDTLSNQSVMLNSSKSSCIFKTGFANDAFYTVIIGHA